MVHRMDMPVTKADDEQNDAQDDHEASPGE
jgi:hypothetical protein